MRKLLALVALFSALAATQVRAGPNGVQCSGFDTAVFGTTSPMAVLQSCTFTTGPYGIVLAVATAEVTCGATEAAQMFYGTGASPVNGSNFLGSATGGVLTVTSNIPGFGPNVASNPGGGGPPFTIQNGQLLSPGSGATSFTQTAIVSQASSTETGGALGGKGTYNIANGALTITAGTNLYTLNALPGGTTSITPNMHQTACNGGFTITAISGTFIGTPNTQYWLDVAISTSNAANQASWNNNGIAIFTY